MENSPIATLSAELRNQIYHLVLTHPEPIVITSSMSGGKVWSRVARRRKLLALTRTCRTIREESIKIFYAINTFKHLASDYGPRPSQVVQKFDAQIGRELAAVICKVVVMPQVIRMTTSSSDYLGGDSDVVSTAKELVYLASMDDSRTYQLQCNFHCYTELQNGPPWQRWEEKLLLDMPDFVMGCKEARAGIRQEIEETDDPAVGVCLSKMDKRIAYWQTSFTHDYSSYS
ncbi:hypothetical protein KC343_g4442 [Hortaea werneckii]|nr:hypothetical protein KC352_g14777 [Hortaea werneckii]KAI7567009.1 hypothetical protein KC317_g5282 [Hortaea werneckii]KAI7618507.1 hypothetical protein KC346_g4972 [Hortaea werneckii]KAI7630735.1 hypothetical protein KC343_g4442 [Hortaea werneckii]KAI7669914.1 hypothetical protein KC319_g6027 [Hortaea werneckii]